jgi:hypothetical protein
MYYIIIIVIKLPSTLFIGKNILRSNACIQISWAIFNDFEYLDFATLGIHSNDYGLVNGCHNIY